MTVTTTLAFFPPYFARCNAWNCMEGAKGKTGRDRREKSLPDSRWRGQARRNRLSTVQTAVLPLLSRACRRHPCFPPPLSLYFLVHPLLPPPHFTLLPIVSFLFCNTCFVALPHRPPLVTSHNSSFISLLFLLPDSIVSLCLSLSLLAPPTPPLSLSSSLFLA